MLLKWRLEKGGGSLEDKERIGRKLGAEKGGWTRLSGPGFRRFRTNSLINISSCTDYIRK